MLLLSGFGYLYRLIKSYHMLLMEYKSYLYLWYKFRILLKSILTDIILLVCQEHGVAPYKFVRSSNPT